MASTATGPAGSGRRRMVPLDGVEEGRLVRRWQRRGDPEARRSLVESCLPLVKAMAWRYRHFSVPGEDLVAEGLMGVLTAIDRFDTTRDVRLSTYARYWIRAYMVKAVAREWGRGKTGMGITPTRLFFRVRRERARFSSEHGDPAIVIEKLCESLGMTSRRLEQMLHSLDNPEFSIDSYVQAGGRDHPPCLASELSTEGPLEEDDRQRLFARVVDAALLVLDPRELVVARRRLMSDEPASLSVLGRELGVSRERARQIEQRALQKLSRAVKREGFTASMFHSEIA